MLAPDVIAEVSAVMAPADHYHPAHKTIHQSTLDLHGQGKAVGPITLGRYLDQTSVLTKVGGESYLHTLVQEAPTVANAAYCAEIVQGDLAEIGISDRRFTTATVTRAGRS